MDKRKKVIDFLSKRYNNISEAKQNGTISWVAIKDEFHQEEGIIFIKIILEMYLEL